MVNKKIQRVLFLSTIATTSFAAGRYYEKRSTNSWTNVKWEAYPALPLFGTVSAKNKPEDNFTHNTNLFVNRTNQETNVNFSETSMLFIFKKLCNLAEQFGFSLDFSSVKAASPITTSTTAVPLANDPSKPNRVSQIMKYGFPGLDNVRSFDDYVLSYDRRNRVAHWVFEHLTEESVRKNDQVDRSKCEFMPDDSIHHFFRADNADYKRSGYDRGHLAAAGNHKVHQRHVEQTFYLSNIAPQVGKGFNRDAWNKLEKYVRKLTKTYPNVYCCTGPLYLPRKEADGKTYVKYEVIGSNHVAVPTHFYKIVVGETKDGKLELESFVMANEVIDDKIPVESFRVPPESIEKAAGLLFFNNISRAKLSKINGKKN